MLLAKEKLPLSKIVETYLIASLSGLLFYAFDLPIPWMLGPITGMLLWKTGTKRTLVTPPLLSNMGLMILGIYFGLKFTKSTFITVGPYMIPYFLITVFIISVNVLNSFVVTKFINVDKVTSAFASVPGGLPEMVAASESLKANTALVTIFQTIRLLTVVFVVPFVVVHLFQGDFSSNNILTTDVNTSSGNYLWFVFSVIAGWLFRNILPAAYVIGPLAATAIMNVIGVELPAISIGLLIFAQISVGMSMGNKMTIEDLKMGGKFGWVYFLLTLFLITISFGCGYVFAKLTNLSLPTAILSLAPGGLVEMVLTAESVGGDPAIVSSLQFVRLLFIILVVPSILKWLFRHNLKGS
ncbi:AbrB family transcriptional regulator [Bacillus alveayuensis]|uniref:AbrB family transcriptional regulator n=1 Tax=Aeribacillus alveayuensis TaxID=279215 RepID=UPI0005D10768|nr:AbrB family transcriptional regulator [Bacillus alveayuensis]